ncbi:MAG: MFS transporter [Bacilli bacterium]
MKKNRNIIILSIFGFLLYSVLNFGHPVTPAFLDNNNIDERYFGILFSSMAFSLTLFSPFWGNKGDSYGRKYIISIGIIGYGIGQLLFGYGNNILIILIGRVVSGVFAAGIFSNLIASFSEVSNDQTRSRNISIITSISMLAAAIGYYLGGKLGMIFSPSTTLIIQGYLAIIIGLSILILYPKTAVVQTRRKSFIKNLSLVKTIDEHIIYFMIVVLLWTFAKNNVSKYFDVFLNNLGFTSVEIGTFIMITGIVGALLTMIFIPYLTKKIELLKLLKFILILIIITLVLTFAIPNRTFLFISYIVNSSLTVMYLTVEQTYISKNIKTNYGAIIGVRESFKAIGLVSGPLIVTMIFNEINSYVFYFNSLMFLLALIILSIFINIRKNN